MNFQGIFTSILGCLPRNGVLYTAIDELILNGLKKKDFFVWQAMEQGVGSRVSKLNC